MRADRTPRGSRRRRPGWALAELVLATVALMAAMGVTVKAVGWVARERRAADRRSWALNAASNVLERVGGEPFEGVTPDRVRAIAEAAGAAGVLPEAAWDVEVADDPGSPTVAGRRVSVRLRWKDRSGDWTGPVRLTSWVYRGGATP